MAEAGELILQPLREAIDRCAIPSAAASVELRAAPNSARRPTCSAPLAIGRPGAQSHADRAALTVG